MDTAKKEEIRRHKTVRDTPQQNILVKRMNSTILEKVKCMLSTTGLPRFFWVETVMTTKHLINRCPSTAIGLKTPQEVWSRKPTNYLNLKVFRCTTYAHVKQNKLQPKALKCIFIGYPNGVKGYKLCCLESG